MEAGKVSIGVDIGGTKTAIVLSAEPPASLARIEFELSRQRCTNA
jgi:N-acetylglucosamine kinase-like BadF-type ATPase